MPVYSTALSMVFSPHGLVFFVLPVNDHPPGALRQKLYCFDPALEGFSGSYVGDFDIRIRLSARDKGPEVQEAFISGLNLSGGERLLSGLLHLKQW